jgi:hypothetical protein
MMTISELRPAHDQQPTEARPSPTMLAIEAVLQWPRRPASSTSTDRTATRWPLLAIVVGEQVLSDQAVAGGPSVLPLFDLLRGGQRSGRVTVLRGTSVWSVRGGQESLLRLAVRASAPVQLDVDILLPARPLRHLLATLSRGATVAITTRQQADRLTAGVSARDALSGLTLVPCQPSPELAALARG